MPKSKVLSSLIYKFSERLMVKGLGLIISIVLARLLSPTEFGQIALIMVFINLSITFIDSGLSTALVQDKHTSDEDYSTVLYISLSIASILIAVLWIISPLIGNYYNDTSIVLPLRIYSFSLLIGAVNSVLFAKMQREMRFKQMMWCNVIACILSGCVGVSMAYAGTGIWALIAYYFSSSLFGCLFLLYVAKWHPILAFSIQRAKTLFSFGWRMLVSGLLCGLYNDIRALIIGKVYTPADLGYYNRGQQFPDVISHTLENAVQSVMFPVMARSQDEKKQIRSILQKTISMGSIIIMPIMLGLAAVAEPFIEIVLTEKWLPCVPYMIWMCIGFTTVPISKSCLVSIKAIGRSDVYMRLEIVRRIAMLIILLTSVICFDSVLAIAVGFAISEWIDYIIISIPTQKLLNFPIIAQIKCFSTTLLCSLLMGVFVYLIGFFNLPIIVTILLQIISGVVIYVLLMYLFNNAAFQEALKVLSHIKTGDRV